MSDDALERFRELRDTGDPTLRAQLVEEHLGLARYLARRYRNRGIAVDDLEQVAALALVKAVDRFDPMRETRFSTFAGLTIDGELKRFFRDRAWAIHVPRRLQEIQISLRSATEELHHALGRVPTVRELAEKLAVDTDEIIQAMDAARAYRTDSVDRPAMGDDASPFERTGVVDQGFIDVERRDLVQSLLSQLPERERRIVELRFFDELSQSEIAARLGISQMHVSRLLRRTVENLRARLDEVE